MKFLHMKHIRRHFGAYVRFHQVGEKIVIVYIFVSLVVKIEIVSETDPCRESCAGACAFGLGDYATGNIEVACRC